MKSRMLRRLLFYFIAMILLFSLLTGSLFLYFARKSAERATLDFAGRRAEQVARSMTKILTDYEEIFTMNSSSGSSSMGNSNDPEEGTTMDKGEETGQDSNSSQGQDGKGHMGRGMGMTGGKGEGMTGGQMGGTSGEGQVRQQHQSGMNGEMGKKMQMMQTPGKNFLAWMNELMTSNIQIVDRDEHWIEVGLDQEPIALDDLDPARRDLVEEAFEGHTNSIIQGDLFEDSVVVVATPLMDPQGEVTGAILLEESVSGSRDFFETARNLFLLSILVGFILAVLVAFFFANHFVSPLKKIHRTTEQMIEGDYRVDTGIVQKDEIGLLAEDIERLAARLEEARQSSEELNQMRDDFISSMSHELKTPVTVLKSSLEALNAGVITDPEDVRDYHTALYRESVFLEQLIRELLELNILRNQKFKVKLEEVDLITILEDAIRSQRILAKESGISVCKDFDHDYQEFRGDYTRLRQMFVTVINNAIKYSTGADLEIIERGGADRIVITVINEGEEIRPETLRHMFEPFYRDQDEKKQGFGLGLAIAKEIADHHGIDLAVESDGGKTSFSFHLSLKEK